MQRDPIFVKSYSLGGSSSDDAPAGDTFEFRTGGDSATEELVHEADDRHASDADNLPPEQVSFTYQSITWDTSDDYMKLDDIQGDYIVDTQTGDFVL